MYVILSKARSNAAPFQLISPDRRYLMRDDALTDAHSLAATNVGLDYYVASVEMKCSGRVHVEETPVE